MASTQRRRSPWYWAQQGVGILFTYAILILVALVMVVPFLYMISISFRPDYSFVTFPLSLIPDNPGLGNYVALFQQSRIARWIFNSVFVSVSVTLLHLVTCSLAGYAFGRGDFPGRDLIFWVLMGTMMIPSTVTIVSSFMLISRLHWTNTYWALIVPFATSTFGTFLCRQAFKSIPRDYDDAALIDGATRFGIYSRVLLPLIGPTLATLTTLTFLDQWNSFMWPLVVTNSATMRTLTVGLTTLVVKTGGVGVSMASATLSFMPTFLMFVFMQRYVVRGITMSGVKG